LCLGAPLRISRSANYIVFSPEAAHQQLIMEYMKFRNGRPQTAMTLPEVLIALLLLGWFLPSVFVIIAVCLRLINASKESTAAPQSVHDRCETY
jgi:hypothetical protein